jgi:hypothetical protein
MNETWHETTLNEAQNILNFIYEYDIENYKLTFKSSKCNRIEIKNRYHRNSKIAEMTFFYWPNKYEYSTHCIKNPYEPVNKGGLILALKEVYELIDVVQVNCNEYFMCDLKPAKHLV